MLRLLTKIVYENTLDTYSSEGPTMTKFNTGAQIHEAALLAKLAQAIGQEFDIVISPFDTNPVEDSSNELRWMYSADAFGFFIKCVSGESLHEREVNVNKFVLDTDIVTRDIKTAIIEIQKRINSGEAWVRNP